MLLGAFCVIALLVTGVLGCIGGSPLDAFAARSAKPVPLTPMEPQNRAKLFAALRVFYPDIPE